MTYAEVLDIISIGSKCYRESWNGRVYLRYKVMFDANGIPVDNALVEMTDREYIGIYTPEPRDEFANDWVIVE